MKNKKYFMEIQNWYEKKALLFVQKFENLSFEHFLIPKNKDNKMVWL